jgi:hypothetical protein
MAAYVVSELRRPPALDIAAAEVFTFYLATTGDDHH